MTNTPNKFNLRVYGLLINAKNEVLISDEIQLNTHMVKFPGGGLEFGEGTIDCLKREIMEECNGQQLKNIRHFYTTDFYQKALFFNNTQLLSIYYLAELDGPELFKTTLIPNNFSSHKNGLQSFRWIKISELNTADFTFPIDKIVIDLLKNSNSK